MNDALAMIEARADSLIDGHAKLLRDLVELRRKHRLTQAEVAERMGVSQPTVAGFEAVTPTRPSRPFGATHLRWAPESTSPSSTTAASSTRPCFAELSAAVRSPRSPRRAGPAVDRVGYHGNWDSSPGFRMNEPSADLRDLVERTNLDQITFVELSARQVPSPSQ